MQGECGSFFFSGDVCAGIAQGLVDGFIPTVEFIDTANDCFTLGNDGGKQIGESGTQIGNRDVCAVKWRRTFDKGTVSAVGGVVATVAGTETLVIDSNIGTHFLELRYVSESVFEDGFVNDGDAFCLGEKNGKGRVPIGHEPGMNGGFEGNGGEVVFVIETNAVGFDVKVATHPAQRIEECE